jgi:hypothetical protein
VSKVGSGGEIEPGRKEGERRKKNSNSANAPADDWEMAEFPNGGGVSLVRQREDQ